MPPRKKGNDKSKEQPPPSSAPPPEVEEEKDNVDVEEKISEFNMASSVAVDTFGNFMNLALNKIFNKHIETHTDAYAASSIIDSLDESIFKLFLVNPKPLTPREKTPTPIPVRPCSWQETSMENDSEIFQLSIVEEADNLQAMQEKIRKKRRQNEQAIPSWLRQPGLQKSDSGISMLQESTINAIHQSQLKREQSTAQSANSSSPKTKTRATKSKLVKKDSATSLDTISAPKISVMDPLESEQVALKERNSITPARLRQFRRRSAQQKSKTDKNKSPRKAPLPPSKQSQSMRLPSVQIVDPKVEAQDYRRQQIKIGKIRPRTESEIKFISGHQKSFTQSFQKTHNTSSPKKSSSQARKMTLAKDSRIKLPGLSSKAHLDNSLMELDEHGNVVHRFNQIGKLPETLVDSLAISDGSGNLLESGRLDDFEGLRAVSSNV